MWMHIREYSNSYISIEKGTIFSVIRPVNSTFLYNNVGVRFLGVSVYHLVTFCQMQKLFQHYFRSFPTGTGLRDGLSWMTDKTKWPDTPFFRVRCTSVYIHSPLLTFFRCFIVLFQSCCSHAQVFGKTLVDEFPIFYGHTEWNLLSSGTNTLLWWRACYKATKLQTNKQLGHGTGCMLVMSCKLNQRIFTGIEKL